MRGRRPKPIEQREREGNAGKRPLPAPLRTGDASVQPPAVLDADGLALWNEITGRLTSVGVLDQVDVPALTILCIQWSRACAAGRVIDDQSHFALGSMGQMVAHPAIAIEAQAHALFLRFAVEYAMTPSARARVSAAAAAHVKADELEAIIGGGAMEIADIYEVSDGEFEEQA